MTNSKLFTPGKEDEVFATSDFKKFLDGEIGNYNGGFDAREQFYAYLAEIEVKKALETVNVWGIKIRPLYVYGKSICSISDDDVYIWDGIGESWVDCYNSADFVKQNYIKVL